MIHDAHKWVTFLQNLSFSLQMQSINELTLFSISYWFQTVLFGFSAKGLQSLNTVTAAENQLRLLCVPLQITLPWAEEQVQSVQSIFESISILQSLASQSPLGEITLNLVSVPPSDNLPRDIWSQRPACSSNNNTSPFSDLQRSVWI